MKFTDLSPTASLLVAELKPSSDAWLNRSGKTCAVLHQLAATGEVAVIPQIVGFLLDGDSTIVVATAATLRTLFAQVPPAQLPAFDELMRLRDTYYGPVTGDPRWHKLQPVQVNAFVGGDPATSTLLLGLACCHWNGYVRQNAIACLDQHVHSGEELPFLLLRLGDWVSAVRVQAEAAISRRLDFSQRENYLACLPLVARLRERKRLIAFSMFQEDQPLASRLRRSAALPPSSPLFSHVEALLWLDVPSLLSNALSATDRVTRRFGLSLAWSAAAELGSETAQRIVEQALQTKDQMAHVQIAHWLVAKEAHPDLQRQFMVRLVSDRIPAVRRLALGWCAFHEPMAHKDALHAALLDRSRSVRAITQFYLPKLDRMDLRSFYREEVSKNEPRSLLAALGGLSETGKVEDADWIIPLVKSPRIAVRKAALSAVAKLAGATGKYLPLFIEALQDHSPGISRQARLALEDHASEIGRDRLKASFFAVTTPHVRRQTLLLINRLPKWPRVTLLVEVVGQWWLDDSLRQTTMNFLWDWFAGYNRTHFAKPSRAELADLVAVLHEHHSAMDTRCAQELQGLVESFRK